MHSVQPQTMVEKIISRKAGRHVTAGDALAVDVDCAMATDGSAPMAIDFFDRLGGMVRHPERIVMVQDHYAPCPNDKVAGLLRRMEDFCARHGLTLYGEGEGVCHRLLPEKGHVAPGDVVVGADSHTTTYGALNALATGIGSSDFAGAMYTGKVWLRVPESVRVVLEGRLSPGVQAKDAALHLVGMLGADGATYRSLEFTGPGLARLDMESRFTICNMVVEAGAKNGVMPCDDVCREWVAAHPVLDSGALSGAVEADPDARYADMLHIDLSALAPQLAAPHAVDNVHPVADFAGRPVHMAVVGTCTNGSLEDFAAVAGVLRGRSLAPGVRLLIVPPSRHILRRAMEAGHIDLFLERGAVVTPPCCGPCCGAMNGVPRDGETVISTANRNFTGRMGNVKAEVFLASPLTVAVSAVMGRISDPRSMDHG